MELALSAKTTRIVHSFKHVQTIFFFFVLIEDKFVETILGLGREYP